MLYIITKLIGKYNIKYLHTKTFYNYMNYVLFKPKHMVYNKSEVNRIC